MRGLCARKSNENPQVTFHLMNNIGFFIRQLYLSVKVSDRNENEDAGGSDILDAFKRLSSPGTTPGQTNMAHRLQELEGIESLITEEEYDHKRQDIINSI